MKRKVAEQQAAGMTYTELIQTAASRVGPLAQAAADRLEAAAGRVGPLAHGAADRLEPFAQRAAGKVAPLAQQAQEFVSPYAQQAAGKVGPLAQQVGTTVGPYALLARQRGAQAAQEVIEKWRPALEEALAKVSPGVEAARDRINDDLLPKLIAALEAAAAAPVVAEASKRGQATLAAAKGELTLPEVQTKPKRRWVKRVLIIAAVGGVVVVVVRRVLGSQDADWQAARPTAPYTPPQPPTPASNGQTQENATATEAAVAGATTVPETSTIPETSAVPETELAAVPEEGSAEQTLEEATAVDGAAPGEPELEPLPDVFEEPSDQATIRMADLDDATPAGDDSDRVEDGIAPEADRSRYTGEGVYVGSEPPEGFTIKANERSMKYHVPESSGYSRTRSEVWFNSEEAAQEAGFIRAQR